MPGGSIPVGPTGALRWMARFDIGDGDGSAMWSAVLNAEEDLEAKVEPTRPATRLGPDSTRMRRACNPSGPADRGIRSPVGLAAMFACFLGVIRIGAADPAPATATTPDPVQRERPPAVGPGHLRPS